MNNGALCGIWGRPYPKRSHEHSPEYESIIFRAKLLLILNLLMAAGVLEMQTLYAHIQLRFGFVLFMLAL